MFLIHMHINLRIRYADAVFIKHALRKREYLPSYFQLKLRRTGGFYLIVNTVVGKSVGAEKIAGFYVFDAESALAYFANRRLYGIYICPVGCGQGDVKLVGDFFYLRYIPVADGQNIAGVNIVDFGHFYIKVNNLSLNIFIADNVADVKEIIPDEVCAHYQIL